jgi:hypothetical protein
MDTWGIVLRFTAQTRIRPFEWDQWVIFFSCRDRFERLSVGAVEFERANLRMQKDPVAQLWDKLLVKG